MLTAPLPLFHVAALHIIANSSLHAGCTGHLKTRFSASRYWEQCAEDGATWAILLGPMAAMVAKMTPDPVPEHRGHAMLLPPAAARARGVRATLRAGEADLVGLRDDRDLPAADDRPEHAGPLAPDGHDRDARRAGWTTASSTSTTSSSAPDEVGELVFRPRIPHAIVSEYYHDPERTPRRSATSCSTRATSPTYDEQGLLHYRSRTQDRIRRRGENVSAPELEWVALTHPEVVEAAAYGVPSELGEEDVKLDVVLARARAARRAARLAMRATCRATWSRATSSSATRSRRRRASGSRSTS